MKMERKERNTKKGNKMERNKTVEGTIIRKK